MKFAKATLIIVCLTFSILSAISINEIKHYKKDYIWGEAISHNPNMADKEALRHLISQISVQVESKFINVIEENNDDVAEYTERVLNTYSNVMLNEAHYLQEEKDGKFHVLRYIKKSEYDKIFIHRENMIHDFIHSGIRAENDLRIGDALKYYYWSLCLLKSHPRMNEIRAKDEELFGYLIASLPEKIDKIFNEIDIKILSSDYNKSDEYRKALLEFRYNGKLISNLDFIYYTGSNWTPYLNTVNNGLASVEFFGTPAKDLNDIKLRIEYVYESKCKIDIALSQVIENTYIPYFSSSQRKIEQRYIPKTPKKEKVKTLAVGVMNDLESEKGQDEKCFNRVMAFKKAFNARSTEDIIACFTPEGLEIFTKLMDYGNAQMIQTGKLDLSCYKLNEQYLLRSIPFKFKFPHAHREFIEDVVFVLNEDALITGLNFALSDIAILDIMKHSEAWGSVERKQQIIYFMESYKTAYSLENIEYIEKIFSDEALIIVGQQLKTGQNIDSMYSSKLKNEDVRYIKLNKKDYLERLQRIFGNSEAINIHFEETEVKRMQRYQDYTYGIQISQYYYSSNYADKGYLFLLFDINDQNEPKIYVRSWQPEKNADGRIIGIEDFIF